MIETDAVKKVGSKENAGLEKILNQKGSGAGGENGKENGPEENSAPGSDSSRPNYKE